MIIRNTKNLIDMHRCYSLISDLDNFYPDFANWYFNKAIPNIHHGDGNLLLAEDETKIIGISIYKNNKLQCVRIIPEWQQKGLGIRLIDKSLENMVDKPELSIPEEQFHFYSRIFINRYNFSICKVEKNKYRFGKLEYFFNNQQQISEYQG